MLDRPQRERQDSAAWSEAQPVPDAIRARGGVRLAFGAFDGQTRRLESAEAGGYRARFPTRHDGLSEAVLINTGGGMTGGDQLSVHVALDAGARAVVTTQAAEKIYRSQGPDTRVGTTLALSAGAVLHWLPQECILFSRARLKRTLTADLAADATLIACESVFFGRSAMGEACDPSAFHDRWRIRRGGKLIFAEDVRLEGDVAAQLMRPAIGGGARAIATLIIAAPDAPARLEAVRAALGGTTSQCGASALDGLVIARLLAPDAAALRADLAHLASAVTGQALPRSWQT
jgi:urease accessory protein